MRDQAWFEMQDIRKRRLSDAVWIPLRASTKDVIGEPGLAGYECDFFGAGSVAFPIANREKAASLDWSRIGLLHQQRSYAFRDGYKRADAFQEPEGLDLGIELMLDQDFDGAESNVWHLNQDLVIALGLLRERDTWTCPHEGYIEVARLKRHASGSPAVIEIRAEHLRDYLAARGMALRVVTYRSRETTVEQPPNFRWPEDGVMEGDVDDRFEARVFQIHEGGSPYGSTTAFFHMGRTDVDPEVDVPRFSESSDSNTKGSSWTARSRGRKLYSISGELWHNEWIEPGGLSPRVRRDPIPATCFFITDAAGKRESADALHSEDVMKWLWFGPEVISALADRRGSSLEWYTRDTGQISALYGYGVHFGLNTRDLITAYANDVARLPEWQQKIWAGFNVAPDGKVSHELLAAQMKAEPAETTAPETLFEGALHEIDATSKKKWGVPLLRLHSERLSILRTVHRFRATSRPGLLALAKDIARLTADSINVEPLHALAPLAKGEKRGSIKSLERALATIIPTEEARRLVGPLAGVYELRLGDAHLPSTDADKAFSLAGVDQSSSLIRQAMQLLEATAAALCASARVIVDGVPDLRPAGTR